MKYAATIILISILMGCSEPSSSGQTDETPKKRRSVRIKEICDVKIEPTYEGYMAAATEYIKMYGRGSQGRDDGYMHKRIMYCLAAARITQLKRLMDMAEKNETIPSIVLSTEDSSLLSFGGK